MPEDLYEFLERERQERELERHMEARAEIHPDEFTSEQEESDDL